MRTLCTQAGNLETWERMPGAAELSGEQQGAPEDPPHPLAPTHLGIGGHSWGDQAAQQQAAGDQAPLRHRGLADEQGGPISGWACAGGQQQDRARSLGTACREWGPCATSWAGSQQYSRRGKGCPALYPTPLAWHASLAGRAVAEVDCEAVWLL